MSNLAFLPNPDPRGPAGQPPRDPPPLYWLPPELEGRVSRLHEMKQRLSRWGDRMDGAKRFGVEGSKGLPFGWEFFVSLVPGIGDLVSFAVNVNMMRIGWTLPIPRNEQLKVGGFALADFLGGQVTGLGDLADGFMRSHRYTADTLIKHADRQLAELEEARQRAALTVQPPNHHPAFAELRRTIFV